MLSCMRNIVQFYSYADIYKFLTQSSMLLTYYLLVWSSGLNVTFHVEEGGSEYPRHMPGADHKQPNHKVDQFSRFPNFPLNPR